MDTGGRRTIIARFNGACRGCEKKITKGEKIFFQGAFKSWHSVCWEFKKGYEDNLARLKRAQELAEEDKQDRLQRLNEMNRE